MTVIYVKINSKYLVVIFKIFFYAVLGTAY